MAQPQLYVRPEKPMPVLPRLVEAYAREGYAIMSGLNPSHYGAFRLAPFTWIIRDGRLASTGLGISVQEVYFFECCFAPCPRGRFT